MRRIIFLVTCFLVCVLAAGSSAEIYRGIAPFFTLGDVKKLFPGATFTKENPAWAQVEDAMYSVTGTGIQGTIVTKFDDYRTVYKKLADDAADNNVKVMWKNTSEESDEDALKVSWVRWIPDAPFAVDRLITKYGKPEKSDFSTEDFKPFKEWTSRGISASLSDDGKKVVSIDFTFTSKETKDAWSAKWGKWGENLLDPPKATAGKKGKKK